MPSYRLKARKPLTAVWPVSIQPINAMDDLLVPEVTVAVDWQADPKVIERDFGVIVARIRHDRRAHLEGVKDVQVAQAARELRRQQVSRLNDLAEQQGEKDRLRRMKLSQSADWPSARKVAEHLGPDSWAEGKPDRVKNRLARVKAAYKKAVLQARRSTRG